MGAQAVSNICNYRLFRRHRREMPVNNHHWHRHIRAGNIAHSGAISGRMPFTIARVSMPPPPRSPNQRWHLSHRETGMPELRSVGGVAPFVNVAERDREPESGRHPGDRGTKPAPRKSGDPRSPSRKASSPHICRAARARRSSEKPCFAELAGPTSCQDRRAALLPVRAIAVAGGACHLCPSRQETQRIPRRALLRGHQQRHCGGHRAEAQSRQGITRCRLPVRL